MRFLFMLTGKPPQIVSWGLFIGIVCGYFLMKPVQTSHVFVNKINNLGAFWVFG
jgi:hypothetical protein